MDHQARTPARPTPPAPAGPEGATAQRRRAPRTWWQFLVLAVVAVALVGLHVDRYSELSLYDEPQHVDYVYHLLDGEVPVAGDRWEPATAEQVACRSIDYPVQYDPPCGGAYLIELFPNYGLTTAFVHTPLYYAGPALAVLAADAVGLPVDDVSLMRLVGALWLLLALGLLWRVWSDLGVRWQVRLGTGLALSSVPVVLLAQSTVTNDATALAAGAALVLAALRWDAGRCRLWVPVAVAVVAMLLKSTNLGALLLVCAFVLVRLLQRVRARRLAAREGAEEGAGEGADGGPGVVPVVGFIVGGALAAAVTGLGWSVYQAGRATFDPALIAQNVAVLAPSFDPAWLVREIPALASPLRPQFFQSVMTGGPVTVLAVAADLGLLALAAVGVLRSRRGSAVRALGVATVLTLFAFGPMLVVVNYVTAGIDVSIPARYGLSLVPALLVLASTAARGRLAGWVTLGVGVVAAATSFAVLAG